MSIRAESRFKFSTYFEELPEYHIMHEMHDRISDAIIAILDDMEINRSHIQAEADIGYQMRLFYGMEGEEVYGLGSNDEEDTEKWIREQLDRDELDDGEEPNA